MLQTQCIPVGGAIERHFAITAPAAGTLRVGVEERGIALVASLDDDPASDSASPIDRLGTIVLVTNTSAGSQHTIRIRAEDSPDVTGMACISGYLLAPTDKARARAESAFAAGGRATRKAEWAAAFDNYLDAARIFDKLGMRSAAAASRTALAQLAYLRLDRMRESLAIAGEALDEMGPDASPAQLGALTVIQANSLLDTPTQGVDPKVVTRRVRALLGKARSYYDSVSYASRETPRLDIMSGFLEYTSDNISGAHDLFTTAANTCRRMRDWDCYAAANQNLAEIASESNNYSAAMADYADALRVLPPELDPKLSAFIWNNYGQVQGIVGLLSSAQRSLQTAMNDYARLGDCLGLRRSLSRSGNLLVQIGTLSDAEDYLQQAASHSCSQLLASNAEGPASDSNEPVEQTGGQRSTGSPRPGPPHAELCTLPLDPGTLARDDKLMVFNSLLALGNALTLEGKPTSARRCIEAATPYATSPRTKMRLANARGSMLLESNDPKEARALFEQALKIADAAKIPAKFEHRGLAQLGLLRSSLLSGDPAQAVQEGIPALRASLAHADIDQTVTALRLIAAGYRGSNRPDEAVHTLLTAADVIEAVPIDQLDGEKRATFLATQHTVFSELTDLYASEAGNNAANAWLAFESSERGRGRSLRFAITQQTQAVADIFQVPQEGRYQQFLRDAVALADAPANVDLTAALDGIARRAQHEELTSNELDRGRIQKTLQDLEASLIEYTVGANDMFAIIIDQRGADVVRLGSKHDIAAAAAKLQDLAQDPESPLSDVRAAAQQLAKQVLWPLTTHLSAKRILLVPDDALYTIPFTALPWSASPADQLVLQHAELSIVPSVLFVTRQAAKSSRDPAPRIELIGDPVFRIPDWRRECIEQQPVLQTGVTQATRSMQTWTDSLPRLPATRGEVQMIARLVKQSEPGSHIETLLGCAAVPSALRRAAGERMDLLHIATHARVDSQRPRLSALALTPEGTGEQEVAGFGLLDILGLKLNSRLVVLSACETSRGRLLPGEGVLGPAQAFLQAGAATVLASYWRIDDQSASDFMRTFYRYLLMDRLPAATALRKTQLDRAAATNTLDWAAFALYGRPDSSI